MDPSCDIMMEQIEERHIIDHGFNNVNNHKHHVRISQRGETFETTILHEHKDATHAVQHSPRPPDVEQVEVMNYSTPSAEHYACGKDTTDSSNSFDNMYVVPETLEDEMGGRCEAKGYEMHLD